MTQNNAILTHMIDVGSITTMQAFRLYNVTRLAARILEIRACGWPIKAERVKLPSGKRVCRYVLK